jgi:hypothetical protein
MMRASALAADFHGKNYVARALAFASPSLLKAETRRLRIGRRGEIVGISAARAFAASAEHASNKS